MSESDSFISEVSEEVRRERLFAVVRRYGWLIVLAIVVVVGAAAANEWRKSRAEARAQAAGDALRAAYLTQDPVTRAGVLGAIADAASTSEPVIRIAHAGALRDAGDVDAAAAVLARVAEDGETGATYRALAALQRVMLLGSAMDASERAATLETLSADGAPFRPLALEQRALMRLDAGDTDAAIEDLRTAMTLPEAPEALRGRARQLIIAAGGALDAETLPGGAPEAPADAPIDG